MVSSTSCCYGPNSEPDPTYQITVFSHDGQLQRHEYYATQNLAELAFDQLKENFSRHPHWRTAHLRYSTERLDTIEQAPQRASEVALASAAPAAVGRRTEPRGST